MALEFTPRPPPVGQPADDDAGLCLLQLAAQMLLEYNVRSSILKQEIDQLAAHLGISARTSVAYRSAAIHLDDGRSFQAQVPEYRINVALSSGVLRLINRVRAGGLAPAEAIEQMRLLQHAAPRHGQWELALLFGLAASALACILQADFGAIAVSGIASATGLLARRALGRLRWPLFCLPFAAAAIGGAMGGLAIRAGLTQTSGLCVVVPALMLVPGPHLINSLYDIFENHIQTGICRLVLAMGILISAALGILLGTALVMELRKLDGATSDTVKMTLLLDVALAGVAACGFGAFYNAPWRVVWISAACGMVGHGIRFLCMAEGVGLPGATLSACIAVGFLASIAVVRLQLPFSGVAFAGAVPMMPGSLLYRSIAGAVRLALEGPMAQPAQATTTLAMLLNALLVVGAMAAGLLVGALALRAVATVLGLRGKEG